MSPSPTQNDGYVTDYLTVEHYPSVFTCKTEENEKNEKHSALLTKEEIMGLNQAGDVRSPFATPLVGLCVDEGN